MNTFAFGLALGTAVFLYAVARALRTQHVPVYLALLGPLIILVGLRRSFVDVEPWLGWMTLFTPLLQVTQAGKAYVVLGILGFVVGIGARARGPGAPALAQVGALMIPLGLLFVRWAAVEQRIWSSASRSGQDVPFDGSSLASGMASDLWWALGLVVVLWLPVAVWGFLRDSWPGLGEGVAAGVLFVLVLRTGVPARDAMYEIKHAWLAAHEAVDALGSTLPKGPHRVGAVSVLTPGPAGEVLLWTPDGWRPVVVEWLGEEGDALFETSDGVLFPPRAMLDDDTLPQVVWALPDDLDAIPDVVRRAPAVVGCEDVEAQSWVDRHPARRSLSCGWWPLDEAPLGAR